jgi:hypothetical protein
MVGRPEKDSLLFQADPAFPVFQDAFDDLAGLIRLVANRDQFGALRRLTVGPKILREALGCSSEHKV